jgi:hypothetical protein
MSKFEEIVQKLKAEYYRKTRDLHIYYGNRRIVLVRILKHEADDYWYGGTIDGVDVEFNFCEAADDECRDILTVYPVVCGHANTHTDYEVPVQTL